MKFQRTQLQNFQAKVHLWHIFFALLTMNGWLTAGLKFRENNRLLQGTSGLKEFLQYLQHLQGLRAHQVLLLLQQILALPKYIESLNYYYYSKGKGAHQPKAHTAGAYMYTGFHSMKHAQEYCYSPLDGVLVQGYPLTLTLNLPPPPPRSNLPVPIYTHG